MTRISRQDPRLETMQPTRLKVLKLVAMLAPLCWLQVYFDRNSGHHYFSVNWQLLEWRFLISRKWSDSWKSSWNGYDFFYNDIIHFRNTGYFHSRTRYNGDLSTNRSINYRLLESTSRNVDFTLLMSRSSYLCYQRYGFFSLMIVYLYPCVFPICTISICIIFMLFYLINIAVFYIIYSIVKFIV